MVRISIIIPFKTGAKYLQDCLDSIIMQRFIGIEIIFIDDNSEENYLEIIEQYKEQCNIKVLQIKNDKCSVAYARNVGINSAQGEYVYFLDSDDYLLDEHVLELLYNEAQKSKADVVFGKKVSTWYKRKVFIETYINDKNLVEEDMNEDVDQETKINQFAYTQYGNDINVQERVKIQLLDKYICKSKELSTISVLHTLLKKDLLKKNSIFFDEMLYLYPDLPFVLSIALHGNSFGECPDAIYVKRKHNDPYNLPSLSQLQMENRVEELLKSYKSAVEIVNEKSILRNILDKKIIQYCINTFAPKLKRRPIEEVEADFCLVRNILKNIPKEIVSSYRGYKKKILRAMMENDIYKSKKIVTLHLAKNKLKTMIKRKSMIIKAIYVHIFLRLSIKDNYIMFESFLGKNYADSCKYIYEYLNEKYPNQYKFIWSLNDTSKKIPGNPIKVKRFRLRYFYYLARCKYFVNNMRQPEWFVKRPDTILLETWHGTPLKKLVFDMDDVYSANPRYKQQFYKQSRAWDYLISDNTFSTEIFKRAFLFDNEILEYGYPRNDLMYAENKDEIAVALRKKLGIPLNKKTILYAPTWRDDEYYEAGEYKFALQLDLQRLKEEIGNEYVILLRTHYFIADVLDVTKLEDFAFNVSKYDDITEIYMISDILITDYSSVFFDYANLKKPILFYTYDLEKYRDVLRGFYISLDEVPGPLLFTNDDIIHAIKNIQQISEECKEKYEKFYHRFCSLDDGKATQRVVEKVFR